MDIKDVFGRILFSQIDANLKGANLKGASLEWASLEWASLEDANLKGASLEGANLKDANLEWANLEGASLDFSCLPLWCGSKNIRIDERQAKQLAMHIFNLIEDFWPGGLTEDQAAWINDCHRIQDCSFDEFVINNKQQ